MHRILLKILSVVLFASLGIGANANFDKHQSVSSPDLSTRFVPDKSHRFRIRTITAGVNLKNTADLVTVKSAIGFLQRAKKKFEDEGYEIQTLRIATQPLPEYLNGKSRSEALADLKKIDEVVSAKGVILSIGPVITDDRYRSEEHTSELQ